MDKATFEKKIYTKWTANFGCPFATAFQRGTTLFLSKILREKNEIALWYIGIHTFVETDPTLMNELQRELDHLPGRTSLNGDLLQEAWGISRIKARSMVCILYLYPTDLPDFSPPAGFCLRQLTTNDAEAMAVLRRANTTEDAERGDVQVTHPIAFGCFAGEQLVAAASGYELAGFMDIGVLTHPDFRGLGLGKSVVGAICEWSAGTQWVIQYRHNEKNESSRRLAEKLSFHFYFKQETIWLY
jgi:hypothetical protein